MTTYTVRMQRVPDEETIEALRGLGSVHLVFEVEGRSRAAVARELGEEYGWRGFDRDWWLSRLVARRTGKVAR